MNRRKFLAAASSLGLAGLPGISLANDWPTKPVRMISGFPPGGIVDIIARIIGDKLSQSLGQPFVVESKPGASGNIATAYVAKLRGDPYTLMLGSSGPLAINGSLYKNLGFDPLADFVPICLLAATPLVLVVSAQSEIKSVPELLKKLATAKTPPFYGSASPGSPQHLAAELFKQRAGVNATHVGYKGGAPALMAVLSGEVLFAFENLALVDAHIKSGRLVALAVSSAQRTPPLPNVPTMIESGVPDFDARGWYGLIGPKDLPEAVVRRLSRETMKAARLPDVRARIAGFGSNDVTNTPEEFRQFIIAEQRKWRDVITAGKITIDA